jgi:hypothetical protein
MKAAANHANIIVSCLSNPPRANFGAPWSTSNGEDCFVGAFAQAYCRDYARLHSGSPKLIRIIAREVPVNGFGIADLVTLSWKEPTHESPRQNQEPEPQTTIRAFELKLFDWRRGLMQAHRYRYFADASILVIPSVRLPAACEYLDTFRNLNVGLWGFDDMTGCISLVFTPRPRRPFDVRHRERAISHMSDVARLTPLSS